MALKMIHSFDHQNTGGIGSGTYTIQNTVARTGYAVQCVPTTTAVGNVQINTLPINAAFPAWNVANCYCTFYFRIGTAPGSGDEEFFYTRTAATTMKASLRLNSSRQIAIYETGNVLEATGTTVLALDTWYRIDVRVGTGTTAAYEVKINGVTELSGTLDATASNFADVYLGKFINRNGQSVNFYFDDVWLSDSAYAPDGEYRVLFDVPNANGSLATGFNDGTSPSYTLLDDAPYDSATTEMRSNDNGDVFTVLFPALSTHGYSIDDVLAVQGIIVAKDAAFQDASMQVRIRSSTTNLDGPSINPLGEIFGAYVSAPNLVTETDPATGSAWTEAAAEDAEIGPLHNNTADMMVTAVYRDVAIIVVAAGGDDYEVDLAGSITPAGAVRRTTTKRTAGSLASAGVLRRTTSKVLAGGLTPAGLLRKVIAKPSAGALTPAGALDRSPSKVLSGSISPSAAMVRAVSKVLAGVLTPTGAAAKTTVKPLAGTIEPTGDVTVTLVRTVEVAGSITPVSIVARTTSKALSGLLTPSGVVSKALSKPVAGSLTPTSALVRAVSKVLAGALGPGGVIAKAVSKTAAGELEPSGELSTDLVIPREFAGDIEPVGSLARSTTKGLAGSLASSGALVRDASKGLGGTITPAAALVRAISKALAGSITPSPPTHVNALTNGGLNTDLSGWLVGGAVHTTFEQWEGAGSAEISSTATYRFIRQDFAVLNGETWWISVYRKGSGLTLGNPAGVQVEFVSGAAGNRVYEDGTRYHSGTFDWERVVLRLDVTASGTARLILAKGYGTAGDGTVWFDAVLAAQDRVLEFHEGTLVLPNLAKTTTKVLAGAAAPAGAFVVSAAKQLAGAIAPAGGLSKITSKITAGSVTPSGAVSRATSKGLVGSLPLAGSLTRAVLKVLQGFLTPTGQLDPLASSAIRRLFMRALDRLQLTAFAGDRGTIAGRALDRLQLVLLGEDRDSTVGAGRDGINGKEGT